MTGMLIILLRGKIEDFGRTGYSGQRANFFFFFREPILPIKVLLRVE